MLVPWLTLFDIGNIRANFITPVKINPKHKSDDFVILIPIWGNIKYLTNINFLKKYPGKIVLCTTTKESDSFYKDINILANRYHFEVIKFDLSGNVKNPWKIYAQALVAHDLLLKESLAFTTAKYVIFIDADTQCRTDMRTLVGAMEREGFDLSSLRVMPTHRKTVAENLQYIEYHIAMKSRKIYPWLTSGAAMIGKREILSKIMGEHSLFFNGGDIEIGKLAHLMSYKIGHIPVTFYTDVPPTLYRLFKQRFSWFCGAFRHSVINWRTNLSTPTYAVYFTFLIFLMLPFKIVEIFNHLEIFPYILAFYIGFNFISNWEIRSWYFFLFPFYALFQVLILPWCGIYRYITTVINTGNFGKIAINIKRNLEWYQHASHWGTALLIVTMVLLTVSTAMQTLIFGQPMEPADVIYMAWKNGNKAADSVQVQLANIMTTQISVEATITEVVR